MANSFQIKAAELVEVMVPAGNTRQQIYFPDLPNIRAKSIQGIEVYSALEQSTSLSGTPVQASADLHECIITLYFRGGEYIVLPLESIRRVINKTNSTFFGDIPALNGQVIDWTKCYISLTTNVSNFANKSFLFNVYYIL
jgi:hypothetical protein